MPRVVGVQTIFVAKILPTDCTVELELCQTIELELCQTIEVELCQIVEIEW